MIDVLQFLISDLSQFFTEVVEHRVVVVEAFHVYDKGRFQPPQDKTGLAKVEEHNIVCLVQNEHVWMASYAEVGKVFVGKSGVVE